MKETHNEDSIISKESIISNWTDIGISEYSNWNNNDNINTVCSSLSWYDNEDNWKDSDVHIPYMDTIWMYPYIYIKVYRKRYKGYKIRKVDIQANRYVHLGVFLR